MWHEKQPSYSRHVLVGQEQLNAVRAPSHPLPGWGVSGARTSPIPSVVDEGDFVLTRSARSALALALRHAEIGAGAAVLIPNYYCPTMVAPVERNGALPVFYPLMADALPDLAWLDANTSANCKALLAVHFFGLPKSLSAVREFCDARGMLLIEDCAHAFFGEAGGSPVGTWGHYSIASLPKFFPILEGGVLVSRELSLADISLPHSSARAELKAVWNLLEVAGEYGRLRGLNAPLNFLSKALRFARRTNGHRLASSPQPVDASDVRGAALADPLLVPARLRRTEEWLFRRVGWERIVLLRRRNYRNLAELIGGHGLSPLFPELPEGAVPYVFPVWLDEPDEVYAALLARALPVLRWDRYWPGAIESRSDIGRKWGHHVIQVLCHQDLTLDDLSAVATSLRQHGS